jgi:hypothetical protein
VQKDDADHTRVDFREELSSTSLQPNLCLKRTDSRPEQMKPKQYCKRSAQMIRVDLRAERKQ